MSSTKQRIIIYRVGAIGDVVHTLPFVKLLRKNNSEAQIEYIVGSQQLVDLLEKCTDYIDKVHLVTKNNLAPVMSHIGSTRVDEFIFLHSGWLKAWWLNLRFIKAAKTSIYKRDDSLSAVANYVISYYQGIKQQLLSDPFSLLAWKTLTPISKNLVPIGIPYVCVVPGVGSLRPHRAYPLDKWIDLITKQLSNTDNNIVLLGGPDEINISQTLDAVAQCNGRVLNLIGKTSLVELVSILSKAKHLYSADTGILHIGAAVGVPITALFSITSEKRFGPFSPYAEVLRSGDCSCNPSATNRPKHCSNLVEGYAKCMQGLELFIENHS